MDTRNMEPHDRDSLYQLTPLLASLISNLEAHETAVDLTKHPRLRTTKAIIGQAVAYKADNTRCVRIVDADGELVFHGRRVLHLSAYYIGHYDTMETDEAFERRTFMDAQESRAYILEWFSRDLPNCDL